jgi:hypothetical protein
MQEPAKVLYLRPRPEVLLQTIRRLSAAGKVSYVDHSLLERMPERGFDVLDVKHVLKKGRIVGEIERGAKTGEWKAKVVGWLDGTTRNMGVVVVVVREQRLLIVTTEWEDL